MKTRDQGIMILNKEKIKTVIMEAEDEFDNRILWNLHETHDFGLLEPISNWKNRYKEPLQRVCFVARIRVRRKQK